jgi:hypothetical protein
MSGAEIIGLISGIITILDTVTKLYNNFKDATDLPPAFREVAQKLPLIQDILQTAERHLDDSNPDDESCQAITHIVELCKDKAQRLVAIFQEVSPQPDSSRLERYIRAVKTLGKANRVESLMKGILEDVQLLAENRAIQGATEAQVGKLVEAIQELSSMPPSVPDEGFPHTYYNSGSGPQNINRGDGVQNNNTGSGQQFTGMIQTLNLGKN